jgi:phosphocarrier protein
MIQTHPTVRCQVEIGHALGLHLRHAYVFAERARQFTAEVRVRLNGSVGDGKCVLDLLCLAAGRGMVVDLEAHGHDAAEAVAALAPLLATSEGARDSTPARHRSDPGSVDGG